MLQTEAAAFRSAAHRASVLSVLSQPRWAEWLCLSSGPQRPLPGTRVGAQATSPSAQPGRHTDVTCTAAGGGDAAAWPSAPPPSAPPGPPCGIGRRCAWPFGTASVQSGAPASSLRRTASHTCTGDVGGRDPGSAHLREVCMALLKAPVGCWGGQSTTVARQPRPTRETVTFLH